MKLLVLTALLLAQLAAGSSGPAPGRARRSPHLYGSGNQYYTSPAGYEVSPHSALYSAQLSPSHYDSNIVSQSQGALYRLPSASSSSYYPSSQTYSSYASAPRVQYAVQTAPAQAQVSAPALYSAEHSEHASSSSHYRLQAPASLTYAQPASPQYVQSVSQYVQPSSVQYVRPSVQYVQPSLQYLQPSSTQYVQSSAAKYVQPSLQYAQPSWQQGSWTSKNPWC